MKPYRLARVAEAIREVASETILYELHDPRVKQVTVTRAEVSGDLQHAKVYVSIMGTDKEQSLTMQGLRHAAGFIQSKLARRLQTRFTPGRYVRPGPRREEQHRDDATDQRGPLPRQAPPAPAEGEGETPPTPDAEGSVGDDAEDL